MKIDTAVDAIRSLLRERGLHAASARAAVLQILSEEHHNRSVEEIRGAALARYPAIDPATVYRTLETLKDCGLVVRVELGDKRTRRACVTQEHHDPSSFCSRRRT